MILHLFSFFVTNPVLDINFQNFLTLPDKSGWDYVNTIAPRIVWIALIIGTTIFFAMLVAGAISWITSGGDKVKVEDARGRITDAITGLIVLFLVFVITGLVNVYLGLNIGDIAPPPPGPTPTIGPTNTPIPTNTPVPTGVPTNTPTPSPPIAQSGRSCLDVCSEDYGLGCSYIYVNGSNNIYREGETLGCGNLSGNCNTIMIDRGKTDSIYGNTCDWAYCECSGSPPPTPAPGSTYGYNYNCFEQGKPQDKCEAWASNPLDPTTVSWYKDLGSGSPSYYGSGHCVDPITGFIRNPCTSDSRTIYWSATGDLIESYTVGGYYYNYTFVGGSSPGVPWASNPLDPTTITWYTDPGSGPGYDGSGHCVDPITGFIRNPCTVDAHAAFWTAGGDLVDSYTIDNRTYNYTCPGGSGPCIPWDSSINPQYYNPIYHTQVDWYTCDPSQPECNSKYGHCFGLASCPIDARDVLWLNGNVVDSIWVGGQAYNYTFYGGVGFGEPWTNNPIEGTSVLWYTNTGGHCKDLAVGGCVPDTRSLYWSQYSTNDENGHLIDSYWITFP
ncbi:MAG: pilin [Candidatus Woesebacteria bacterium]|jgi:hypothetical protein